MHRLPAVIALSAALAAPAAAADRVPYPILAGPARVIDGDTIDIATIRIRLAGIDAPERGQRCMIGEAAWPCGREATRALRALIAGRPVACRPLGRERHGRVLATCKVAGRDLGREMALDGWALAYTRYDLGYVLEETYAQIHARGMWRGAFIEPWRWRRGAR